MADYHYSGTLLGQKNGLQLNWEKTHAKVISFIAAEICTLKWFVNGVTAYEKQFVSLSLQCERTV